jgi:hypothetical protein
MTDRLAARVAAAAAGLPAVVGSPTFRAARSWAERGGTDPADLLTP